MGKVRTGYNSKTKENLHTGAGAFFKNFIVGVDTYDSARNAGKLIGATQGGGEFKVSLQIRSPEIDGLPGKAMGVEIIDGVDVSMTSTFIETTPEILAMALGAADIDTTTNGSYDIIKGRNEFKDDDYLENITYVGTITGKEEPVIIQVYNALSTDGLNIKVEDKKEGTVPVTFYGHYADNGDGTLDAPPYAIYYPKGSNVLTPVADIKGGSYATSKTVALTCGTSGAAIHYTINGFEPTITSPLYAAAISIATSTILKAKAFKTGMADSSTMTEIYRIG